MKTKGENFVYVHEGTLSSLHIPKRTLYFCMNELFEVNEKVNASSEAKYAIW